MAYVNPLDPTTPLGSDAVSQGDDMFRLVKAALIERIDSFFTGHDVQPWQAKSGSGAASLWIVSDAVEAVTRLAYTGAGSRSVELFANSTVAGLRDTTGPLTILSYTYSSALTVLNTTGSMQLKVGVGQTIQTIVNGVTIGTWSAAGVTIASGTLTLGATAAVAGLIRLPNQNTISWRSAANNDDLRLWVNFSNVLVFDNASAGTPQAISVGAIAATTITGTNTGPGSFKFGDAAFSDGVISMYGNADTQNILAIKSSAAYSTNTGKAIIVETNLGALVFTVAGNGAITTAGGITVSAGGLAVNAGGASITGNTTISSGILALTGTTTGASAGDIVLANAKSLRGVGSGGSALNLIQIDAANVIQIGLPSSGIYAAIGGRPLVSLDGGASILNGVITTDTTNNRLVYYSGGARYYLAGTAF